MGFHKRYIDDQQVIDIYREQGNQGVIDWYTRGVDALVVSGELSESVEEIIYSVKLLREEKLESIERIIGIASVKKNIHEKETTLTSS